MVNVIKFVWAKALFYFSKQSASSCHIGNWGFSCVYFGDHITTEYLMYYATYCIFFSLFLARAVT